MDNKRKLTGKEAECYWMNYPNVAKIFEKDGLTPFNASFSWNYHLKSTGEERDTYCWKNQVTGKYERKLNQKQANCYWMNYPSTALTFQNQDLPLDTHSA